MTSIFTKKQPKKIAQQKLAIRNSIWPDLDENKLWRRLKSDGWLSVPRAFPLLLRILDMLAPKGKPVSQTYLDLWCRTYDDSFVIVSKPREMAYYAGFSGERAQHTWANRIQILEELGFIDVKSGVHGRINYILILNPYQVINKHYAAGHVKADAYNALRERAIEIGAMDLNADIEGTKNSVKAKKGSKVKKG